MSPTLLPTCQAVTSSQARPIVLLVQRNEGMRRALVKLLALRGFEAAHVTTVADALQVIRRDRPAAAIVDLRLPRLSGVELVAAIPLGAPVLMLSPGGEHWQELERLRPRSRLVQTPGSLVLLIETLEEMLGRTPASDPGRLAGSAA